MPNLFSPLKLAQRELSNRITVSPMGQYSAIDGVPTDWMFIHYGMLSNSGASLLMLESTNVEDRGRGTLRCPGLYNDAQEREFARIVSTCHAHGSALIGVQLNHSGRKGSSTLPWDRLKGSLPLSDGGWETISASSIPFGPGWLAPREADDHDLAVVTNAFVDAANRTLRANFDFLEIHGGHGYMLHSFLSPLSNRRTDKYGGSLDNRMRFPLEVVEAVRRVWPNDRPFGLRVSSTDWDSGGWNMDDTVVFVRHLQQLGCDYVCMSSGATTALTKPPIAPNYQVEFATRVKREISIPVGAVGLITTPQQALNIIVQGKADMVTIGRAFLDNPHWAWLAANRLGVPLKRPHQYQRTTPAVWPGAPDADLASLMDQMTNSYS